ncbi:MAG TPA: hypothetical protein VMT64_08905, partial [Candidatus Binataceae bacterium]|nr:hypothetical protein [Candidatus Binataceae bacterium]
MAVNLMDITAHLMAAIDKAAGPLDRLADAAEDANAHVAHASRLFRRPLVAALMMLLVASAGSFVYFLEHSHQHPYAADFSDVDKTHASLGGFSYALDRKQFEARLKDVEPESIKKYF